MPLQICINSNGFMYNYKLYTYNSNRFDVVGAAYYLILMSTNVQKQMGVDMRAMIQNFKGALRLAAVTLVVAAASVSHSQEGRNVSEYNKQFAIALDGYDPVSYFPEGGAKPSKGLAEHRTNHLGVMYYFANAENAKLFSANPEKYEPTYGSWCAYAMARNSPIAIDPLIFTIHGNRAHFFVAKRAKRDFDAELVSQEIAADNNWLRMSGEQPRK